MRVVRNCPCARNDEVTARCWPQLAAVGLVEIRVHISERYTGAVRCRHLYTSAHVWSQSCNWRVASLHWLPVNYRIDFKLCDNHVCRRWCGRTSTFGHPVVRRRGGLTEVGEDGLPPRCWRRYCNSQGGWWWERGQAASIFLSRECEALSVTGSNIVQSVVWCCSWTWVPRQWPRRLDVNTIENNAGTVHLRELLPCAKPDENWLGRYIYIYIYISSAVTIRLFQTRFDSIHLQKIAIRFDFDFPCKKKKFNVKVL